MPNGMICAAELLRVADDPVDSVGPPDVCANDGQLTALVAVNGLRSRAGLDSVSRLVDSNG
jgi:hypothetical protein